ncbi:MAG: ABC transporter permease [Gemmatales bacterium]|nr:MAG: ABC transporter permease [Gemmatales bacterium]
MLVREETDPWGLAVWPRIARKYFNIYRTSLMERVTYRGDFFLRSILRFLPLITTILLWRAVYAGSGKTTLSGFAYNEMIAYLLLVHVSRMFSSMPGLATNIARTIREGELKKYLLQPVDMIGFLLSYRIAHKSAYIVTVSLPYGLLFFVCRGYFPGWPDPTTMVAYVLALILGFFIGFFFECSMGMVGFWMLEVSSLLYIVNTMNFFLSGHMFPLDLLPGFWVAVLKALPFHYMAYFPAAIFLGKVNPDDLPRALAIEFLWVIIFVVMARCLFRFGVKRYSAYGG